MNTTNTQHNASIFLNYRHEDSIDATSRLHDDLVRALGADNVFIDRDIPSGSRWPEYLRERVNAATIVIAVIGKYWLVASDHASHRRKLDAEGDWVCAEIEEALRAGKVVIPVLVSGAEWPLPDHFPPAIRQLANLQKFSISSENWHSDFKGLLQQLARYGMQPEMEDLEHPPVHSEPSFLNVIDYFYRRIGEAASGEHAHAGPNRRIVECNGLSNLWASVEDLMVQKQPLLIHVKGQLSPYAPLLCGNPAHKRRLHLELRQGVAQLTPERFGYEFGEILNGLLSYSAGQMVIRPYFQSNYVYLGLYESIVRNSIPVMIKREYYSEKLLPLFRGINCLEVSLQGFLGAIPNYTLDALNDFGITERLRSVLDDETLKQVGKPNCALFVDGDDNSKVDLPEKHKEKPYSRYLDGDVWVANAANSIITRFIDISSREDMQEAVNHIYSELRRSMSGRGILSSFDVRMAKIEDEVPDRVLSAAQLQKAAAQ